MPEPDEDPPLPTGYRLGDDIEDYCARCRALSTHAVAGLLEGGVAKVLCRLCLTEHRFGHGQGGREREVARKRLARAARPSRKKPGTA